MSESIITTNDFPTPTVEPLGYQCKFTVSRTFRNNILAGMDERRIEFDGFASPSLIGALVEVISKSMDTPDKGADGQVVDE